MKFFKTSSSLLLLIGTLLLFFVSSCEEEIESMDKQVESLENQMKTPENKKDHVNGLDKKGVPSSATVMFGDPKAGSPFPPEEEHDESFHAKDKIVPRTVVIAEGGNITYEIHELHQVAIYKPGTKPEDIDLTALDDLTIDGEVLFEDFVINDSEDRIVRSPLSFPHITWTTPEGTFDEPGRYLVICTTLPHFALADMYGWVIVK